MAGCFNFKVSFCETPVDISCDDLSSFLFALEESDLAWSSEIGEARLFFDEMEFPMNNDEFDNFVMMIEDTPPQSPVPIQVRLDVDYSEIEEPAQDLDEVWISNLRDLQKAMNQIAPSNQYEFEIVLNDCPITDDEILKDMIIGDVGNGYIVSFANVTKKQPPPPQPKQQTPEPEPVYEPPEKPRRTPEPATEINNGSDNESIDSLFGDGDDPNDDVKEPEQPPEVDDNGDDSGPDWFDEDDDGDDWMDVFGDDESEHDADDFDHEEKKEVEDPTKMPITGVLPVDSDDEELKPKPKPKAHGGSAVRDNVKQPHEWDALKARIDNLARNMMNVEESFSVEIQGGEVIVKEKASDAELARFDKKDLKKAKTVKQQIKTDVGAAALVYAISRENDGFKNSAIKQIVGVVCRGILDYGTDWFGAQVIRALLMRKLYLAKLVETIRKECKELVKKPPGALTIQYSLQTADQDENRRPNLLNILLERGKKDKWLQTLLRIAQHSYGSILLQVAMFEMDHQRGHTYFCEPLANLPPDQLVGLCTHEHGYLFVQALIVTCLAESVPAVRGDCHDRIWGALKQIAADVAQDERGRYVMVTALRFGPETHRSDLELCLERTNLLDSVRSVMETSGGPGMGSGEK